MVRSLNDVLRDDPQLHWRRDGYVSYRLETKTLQYIDANISSQAKTIETGAGVSTVIFGFSGARHTCIVPSEKEISRIKYFCRQQKISLRKVKFIQGKSETVLPGLQMKQLDFALIDGDHKFPVPFLDWYYLAPMLKIGARLVIDDLQLWTGDVLARFLMREPGWKFDCYLGRAASFIKLAEGSTSKWWRQQPFMLHEGSHSLRRYYLQRSSDLIAKNGLARSIPAVIPMLAKALRPRYDQPEKVNGNGGG